MELRDLGRYCVMLVGLTLCDAALWAVTGREGIGMDACITLAAASMVVWAVREVRP